MTDEFDQLLDEIRSRPGVQAQIQAGLAEAERELALERLRQGQQLTQAEVAARLGVSQRRVSAIEHSSAIEVDTLRRYIESLGGTMEIIAVLDGERIRVALGSRDDADSGSRDDAGGSAPWAATA